MAKKPARASDGSRAGINDDIGEEMRLTMYRMQVEIRESEQRAFDLCSCRTWSKARATFPSARRRWRRALPPR